MWRTDVAMMWENGKNKTPKDDEKLVGGLEHFFIFPYIGNNHPNWRTHIFQRGGEKPPTRKDDLNHLRVL